MTPQNESPKWPLKMTLENSLSEWSPNMWSKPNPTNWQSYLACIIRSITRRANQGPTSWHLLVKTQFSWISVFVLPTKVFFSLFLLCNLPLEQEIVNTFSLWQITSCIKRRGSFGFQPENYCVTQWIWMELWFWVI